MNAEVELNQQRQDRVKKVAEASEGFQKFGGSRIRADLYPGLAGGSRALLGTSAARLGELRRSHTNWFVDALEGPSRAARCWRGQHQPKDWASLPSTAPDDKQMGPKGHDSLVGAWSCNRSRCFDSASFARPETEREKERERERERLRTGVELRLRGGLVPSLFPQKTKKKKKKERDRERANKTSGSGSWHQQASAFHTVDRMRAVCGHLPKKGRTAAG